MRSTLATVILGMSLVAGCEVGDVGGGGGGGGGDDTGGGTDAAVSSTPKVEATVDKPTVSTDLGSTTMLTVTVTASGGFSGPVTLTPKVVDTAGVVVPGWTVMLNNTTLNLTEDGTATAVATLTIPSVNQGLAGKVQIDMTSTAGAASVSSQVTALNQVTLSIPSNALGQCILPGPITTTVKVGTKLRFVNKFTTTDPTNLTIHVLNGDANGVPHEPDPGHAQDAAYERTITGVAGSFTWWCHDPALDPGANRPRVTVVP